LGALRALGPRAPATIRRIVIGEPPTLRTVNVAVIFSPTCGVVVDRLIGRRCSTHRALVAAVAQALVLLWVLARELSVAARAW